MTASVSEPGVRSLGGGIGGRPLRENVGLVCEPQPDGHTRCCESTDLRHRRWVVEYLRCCVGGIEDRSERLVEIRSVRDIDRHLAHAKRVVRQIDDRILQDHCVRYEDLLVVQGSYDDDARVDFEHLTRELVGRDFITRFEGCPPLEHDPGAEVLDQRFPTDHQDDGDDEDEDDQRSGVESDEGQSDNNCEGHDRPEGDRSQQVDDVRRELRLYPVPSDQGSHEAAHDDADDDGQQSPYRVPRRDSIGVECLGERCQPQLFGQRSSVPSEPSRPIGHLLDGLHHPASASPALKLH